MSSIWSGSTKNAKDPHIAATVASKKMVSSSDIVDSASKCLGSKPQEKNFPVDLPTQSLEHVHTVDGSEIRLTSWSWYKLVVYPIIYRVFYIHVAFLLSFRPQLHRVFASKWPLWHQPCPGIKKKQGKVQRLFSCKISGKSHSFLLQESHL